MCTWAERAGGQAGRRGLAGGRSSGDGGVRRQQRQCGAVQSNSLGGVACRRDGGSTADSTCHGERERHLHASLPPARAPRREPRAAAPALFRAPSSCTSPRRRGTSAISARRRWCLRGIVDVARGTRGSQPAVGAAVPRASRSWRCASVRCSPARSHTPSLAGRPGASIVRRPHACTPTLRPITTQHCNRRAVSQCTAEQPSLAFTTPLRGRRFGTTLVLHILRRLALPHSHTAAAAPVSNRRQHSPISALGVSLSCFIMVILYPHTSRLHC